MKQDDPADLIGARSLFRGRSSLVKLWEGNEKWNFSPLSRERSPIFLPGPFLISQAGGSFERKTPSTCRFTFYKTVMMNYPSSHHHGSVKNGSISNRFVTFQFSNYFPLPWAARQEKITSTITTVDGVKNPLRLLVSPIYLQRFYLYIYTSHVVATANNSEPSTFAWSRKQQRNESRRRSESLGFGIWVASWDSKCHLAPLSAPSSPKQTQEFCWQKKMAGNSVTKLISKNRVFSVTSQLLLKNNHWTFFSHEWLCLAGSKIGVHLFLAARVPRP